MTEEMVEVHERSDGIFSVDRFNAASSISSDTLAAVNDLVVLAVKKTVSGVTGTSGRTASP
jgi:hypothetical protein